MLEAVALQGELPVEAPGMMFSSTFILLWLALVVAIIGGMWKTFQKAGQPGWAAIVPIYNIVVLMRIARKPGWWVLLCLIPIVNIIVIVIVSLEVAKNFGKGTGFGLGLAFLSPIFYGILGYGGARYQPVG